MARPKKIGLDYFPVDVEFDEKVQAIELLHKNDGLVWVIRFWQSAYKNEYGEVNLSELFGELFTNKCRITTEQHTKILDSALKVGFCYKTESGLYTSDGIKKRISAVSKDRFDAIERKNKDKNKEKKSKVKETPHCSANNKRTIFSEKSPEYIAAKTMFDYISGIGTKMKTPDLQKWSVQFDLIHRIDKRDYDWTMDLIHLVYKDNFWCNVIRSPEKFRKQINDGKLDKLIAMIKEWRTDDEVLEMLK